MRKIYIPFVYIEYEYEYELWYFYASNKLEELNSGFFWVFFVVGIFDVLKSITYNNKI